MLTAIEPPPGASDAMAPEGLIEGFGHETRVNLRDFGTPFNDRSFGLGAIRRNVAPFPRDAANLLKRARIPLGSRSIFIGGGACLFMISQHSQQKASTGLSDLKTRKDTL